MPDSCHRGTTNMSSLLFGSFHDMSSAAWNILEFIQFVLWYQHCLLCVFFLITAWILRGTEENRLLEQQYSKNCEQRSSWTKLTGNDDMLPFPLWHLYSLHLTDRRTYLTNEKNNIPFYTELLIFSIILTLFVSELNWISTNQYLKNV